MELGQIILEGPLISFIGKAMEGTNYNSYCLWINLLFGILAKQLIHLYGGMDLLKTLWRMIQTLILHLMVLNHLITLLIP